MSFVREQAEIRRCDICDLESSECFRMFIKEKDDSVFLVGFDLCPGCHGNIHKETWIGYLKKLWPTWSKN